MSLWFPVCHSEWPISNSINYPKNHWFICRCPFVVWNQDCWFLFLCSLLCAFFSATPILLSSKKKYTPNSSMIQKMALVAKGISTTLLQTTLVWFGFRFDAGLFEEGPFPILRYILNWILEFSWREESSCQSTKIPKALLFLPLWSMVQG